LVVLDAAALRLPAKVQARIKPGRFASVKQHSSMNGSGVADWWGGWRIVGP
jgi:hypothetical protein